MEDKIEEYLDRKLPEERKRIDYVVLGRHRLTEANNKLGNALKKLDYSINEKMLDENIDEIIDIIEETINDLCDAKMDLVETGKGSV